MLAFAEECLSLDVDGVPLDTEISGTKPAQPLTPAPFGQPNSQGPTDVNGTPKTSATSSGVTLLISSAFMTSAVLANLAMLL